MHAQSTPTENQSTSFAKGALFIIIGSSSYGLLSTFVKLSYKQNYTTAEVILAQFILGMLAMTMLAQFFNKSKTTLTRDEVLKLMITGLPIGLTSIFYYLSVKYITASVGVVLLMQTVWIGVLFESILTKKFPSIDKIIAVAFVIFGTLLATRVLGDAPSSLDIRGVILGLMSAMSFSSTMLASSKVAIHLPPIKRSQYMIYGGLIAVLIFGFLTQIGPYYFNIHLVGEEFIKNTAFKPDIFLSYGLILAIFGTIIPPLMLNKGFPVVGVGLGSILSSIELPFANIVAFLLLGEEIVGTQWLGVFIIIAAICMLNYKLVFSKKTKLSLDGLTN